MQKIHILETKSTNTFLIDAIAKGGCYDEYDVIYTQRQRLAAERDWLELLVSGEKD